MSNLELALFYFDQGLQPIPVKNKIPLTKWGEFHHERSSREEVQEWFTSFPEADIGLVTGPVSGLLVLDRDGEEGAQQLVGKEVPKTWTASTINAGKHYYFRFQDGLDVSTLAGLYPSVDVRGLGGYVVAYQWDPGCAPWECELADAPQWLVEELRTRGGPKGSTVGEQGQDHWLSRLLDGVGEGERHHALVKLCSYYLSRMPKDVVWKLMQDWNEKNKPPMDEGELEFQFNDIMKRFESGKYVSEFKDDGDGEPKVAVPLESQTAEQLLARYSTGIDWIVEGLIPKGTSTLFAGWQGRGKSWLAADLAIEIAKGGGSWFGHLPVQGGKVLYVDNENAGNLVSRRLSRLLSAKGISPKALDLHFYIRNRIKLTNLLHLEQLKAKIREVGPSLVIVDSFASAHTLDENKSADMRLFFDDILAPITNEFGCSFLIIDHENKGLAGLEMHGSKRLRGSGAKGDAADVLLSLNEKDSLLVLEHSKARYTKRIRPMVVNINDTDDYGTLVQFGGYVG